AISRQGYPRRSARIETPPLEPEPVHTGGGSAATWPSGSARAPDVRRPQHAMSEITTSTPRSSQDPVSAGDYGEAFPASTKVYTPGDGGIRVPMRRIALSPGEPPLDVYDTSGPLGHDVRDGLPELRRDWIRARDVVEGDRRIPPAPGSDMNEALKARTRRALRGNGAVTQLHYARRGEITPE